jgi:uncharacterized protein (DUF433 family)
MAKIRILREMEKKAMPASKIRNYLKRITLNPDICHGKPTVRNLRYPVETILDLLSSGMTVKEILADHPDLVDADIRASIAYR